MNIQLFQRLTNRLLLAHFGIDNSDTDFTQAEVVRGYIASDMRPYEVVNELAAHRDLTRIDVQGRFGTPSTEPLTSGDEIKALATIEPIQVTGEDPTACPKCGTRSHFDELEDGRQVHRCINTEHCGHEFVAEADEEEAAA